MVLQVLLATLLPLAYALPQGGGMAGTPPKFVSIKPTLIKSIPVTI